MKSTKTTTNTKGLECLNCGYPLTKEENYCPNCSQINDVRKFSVKEIITHFLGGFFAFDSLFFKTLKPLVLNPGKVSREFIEGKRKKYTNPFQLLLHTSILFFIVLGLISTLNKFYQIDSELVKITDDNSNLYENYDKQLFEELYLSHLDSIQEKTHFISLFKAPDTSSIAKDSVYQNLFELGIRLVFKNYQVNNYKVMAKDIALFTNHISNTNQILNDYLKNKKVEYNPVELKDFVHNEKELNIGGKDSTFVGKFNRFFNFSRDNEDFSPKKALDSLHEPITSTNLFLYQKTAEVNKFFNDEDYQKSFINSILSKISLALFILLPLFTFVFWFLYIRHKYTYSDHLILVFHLQTVFFLLLLISVILDSLFKTSIFKGFSPFIFMFYLYKSLRNFYLQNRFKTLIKFLLINIFYFIFGILGFLVVSFLVFLL